MPLTVSKTRSTVMLFMHTLSRQALWRLLNALMQGLHAMPAQRGWLLGPCAA